MEIIPSYKILKAKFDERFLEFDAQDYENVSKEREKSVEGHYKASGLLLEIAQLSAFFASEKLRKQISQVAVSVLAFVGWQLAHKNILDISNTQVIDPKLRKYAKSSLKTIKKLGCSGIKVQQIAWMIVCCAMLKEKIYSKFNYDLKAFSIKEDEGDDRLQVAYVAQPVH